MTELASIDTELTGATDKTYTSYRGIVKHLRTKNRVLVMHETYIDHCGLGSQQRSLRGVFSSMARRVSKKKPSNTTTTNHIKCLLLFDNESKSSTFKLIACWLSML